MAEGLSLARQAGATTVALTATPGSRVGGAADRLLLVTTPAFPDPPGTLTPGVRSYAANQLTLYSLAAHLAQARGQINADEGEAVRGELLRLADAADETIAGAEAPARETAEAWIDAQEYVYLGGGPNYATAHQVLPLAEGVREMFSPLVAVIPGAMFAAHRAELIGEPYFRGFGGGRSPEGGGISRIRTSEVWDRPYNP